MSKLTVHRASGAKIVSIELSEQAIPGISLDTYRKEADEIARCLWEHLPADTVLCLTSFLREKAKRHYREMNAIEGLRETSL